MKKSYLNTAINIALTSIVLSSLVLQAQASASTTDNATGSANNEGSSEMAIIDSKSNSTSNNDISTNETSEAENYLYTGMGVGAATGTLIAGPVGFVVGGAIGAFIGVNKDVETAQADNTDRLITSGDSQQGVTDNNMASDNVASQANTEDSLTAAPVQIAQIGSLNSAVISDTDTPQEELMNILVSDLSLDVYFRSGSTDIEKFYPARLAAIANLINNMDNLELHLDGYTDRRGDKNQNIALANTRIERVREQLINAGVSPERIVSKAFGEAKMKSAAGNLEAYTFDRRVVIRFERMSNLNSSVDTALLETITTDGLTAGNEKIVDENIAIETTSDEINNDQPLSKNSGPGQINDEISEPVVVGFVTVGSAADSKTAQTPALEETNPTVADVTNRF